MLGSGRAVARALHTNPKYGATLTKSELLDNAILAMVIFLMATFIRDIMARCVYFCPRFLTSSDSLSYHGQARMLLHDNLLRRVWNTKSYNVLPAKRQRYKERNLSQGVLVVFASAILVIFELLFTVLVLPASGERYTIRFPCDHIIGFHAARHTDGEGKLRLPYAECATAPLLSVAHVKSEVSWSWCYHKNHRGGLQRANNASYGRIRVQLFIGNEGNSVMAINRERHYTDEGIIENRGLKLSVRVYLNGICHQGRRETLKASFASSLEELTNSFLRNARLTQNQTGLVVRFDMFRRRKRDNRLIAHFTINATASSSKTRLVHDYVSELLGGSIEFRRNGSRLIHDAQGQSHDGSACEGNVKVGNYVGTMIPPAHVLYVAAVVTLICVVARIVFRNPPGSSWEVITAHGRFCADRPLTGPNSNRFITKSRNGSVCYVGFGVPPGFIPTQKFLPTDVVDAKPFTQHFENALGVQSLSPNCSSSYEDWEYNSEISMKVPQDPRTPS